MHPHTRVGILVVIVYGKIFVYLRILALKVLWFRGLHVNNHCLLLFIWGVKVLRVRELSVNNALFTLFTLLFTLGCLRIKILFRTFVLWQHRKEISFGRLDRGMGGRNFSTPPNYYGRPHANILHGVTKTR